MVKLLTFNSDTDIYYHLVPTFNEDVWTVYYLDDNYKSHYCGTLEAKINPFDFNFIHNKQSSLTCNHYIGANNIKHLMGSKTGFFTVEDGDKLSASAYYTFVSYPSSVFEDTMAFQKQFELWKSGPPAFLDEHEMSVKLGHMKEELEEAYTAYTNKDLAGFADALVDLIYVVSGCMNLMNLPSDQLWNDVHRRNMCKVRATKETIGKRGSTFDVVKPADFVSPRTEDIIEISSEEYAKLNA